MARKFLFIFAGLVVLVLAAAFTYSLWGDRLLRFALVPGSAFHAPTPRSAADYGKASLWLEHGTQGDLALPLGVTAGPPRPADRQAAIFYVHPTSFIDRSGWNVPDNDKAAEDLARIFLSVEANSFAGLGPLWAPRYRQATFGAFLSDKPEANFALYAAYRDIAVAFEAFLAANPKGPIILAGHSQGARHLMRMMARKVRGEAVAQRIVAAYLIGWPVSTRTDLPMLGLPACSRPDQTRCILSWQSFAEPADAKYIMGSYEESRGLNGKPRRGTPMLCTNPLTGTVTGATLSASANLGMAKRDEGGKQTLIRPGVGAHCDARGFLLIDGTPDLGPYVLPGNNYHVYDYALFWTNIRADAARRLDAFLTR